ncbi:hypothetical protein ACLOJK_004656 [Asimina triloba]
MTPLQAAACHRSTTKTPTTSAPLPHRLSIATIIGSRPSIIGPCCCTARCRPSPPSNVASELPPPLAFCLRPSSPDAARHRLLPPDSIDRPHRLPHRSR